MHLLAISNAPLVSRQRVPPSVPPSEMAADGQGVQPSQHKGRGAEWQGARDSQGAHPSHCWSKCTSTCTCLHTLDGV